MRKQEGRKKEAILNLEKAVDILRKKSMLDESKQLEQEIKIIENEIKNTPWWQKQIF